MSTKVFGPTPSTLVRTPIYGSQIVTFESGIEQRNKIWENPRFEFELGWKILDETDVRSIMNFYMEHGGDFEAFLFQDPTAAANSGQVLGKGTGYRTLFKIYGNRAASISAYVNGGAVTYTTSLDNGTVTFAAAPASGSVITADVTSERFVVRFRDSRLNQEYFIWRLVREQRVGLLQDKGLL